MRTKRTGIALLLAAGLAGCGSSGDNTQALTPRQVQGLVAQLETARAAAAARNVAGTKLALEKFRASVARLRRDGALTDDAARSLRIGAARVLARVKSDNPTPAPTPTPTRTPTPPATQTPPAPAPLPPGQKKKHEEKQKHGKGHGNKHEGGD